MGRLIDADALIASLEEYLDKPVTTGLFATITELQPTAYDPEKVVAELKEISEIYCEEYRKEEGSLYLQDAMKIVRRGGV